MRILLIAEESADTRYLHKALVEAAHSLEPIRDVRDALFVAASEPFDAVILHMSAVGDVAGFLASARELARNVQGATLVAIGDVPDPTARSELLWLGIDACFPRQFSFMELHERVRRLHALREKRVADGVEPVRAAAGTAASSIPRLDVQARAVVQGDRRTSLTRHEFLLLECLMRARDAAIARAEITRYAWPDKDDINPSSVNLVISRLRKKLEAGGFALSIETVAGMGYRLVQPLNNPSF
ncbi:DNA-binding response regulator [Pararobbsia alpina]|uniref:winged helix-turn-helix transcriptional regulator n=1 Tax=Pararobbsia alpina TaxID=621374 RepID=UPI0039A60A50